MNQKDITKETYTSNAEAYLDKFSRNGVREKDIEEVFTHYTGNGNPLTVELGCAGGRDAACIQTYTNRYIGVDYIPFFIERARKETASGIFLIEDLKKYTPPQGTHIVFAFASLLHLNKEELRDIFKKIFDSLAPLGLFRISLKYREMYIKEEKDDTCGLRIFYYYDTETLRELAKDYTIIFIRKEDHAKEMWLEVLLKKPFDKLS